MSGEEPKAVTWKHAGHYHCPDCACEIQCWKEYFWQDFVRVGGCPKCPRIAFEGDYGGLRWIKSPDKDSK